MILAIIRLTLFSTYDNLNPEDKLVKSKYNNPKWGVNYIILKALPGKDQSL